MKIIIIELLFEIRKDNYPGNPPVLKRNMLSGTIPDQTFKTQKKDKASVSVALQQEKYEYSNYRE